MDPSEPFGLARSMLPSLPVKRLNEGDHGLKVLFVPLLLLHRVARPAQTEVRVTILTTKFPKLALELDHSFIEASRASLALGTLSVMKITAVRPVFMPAMLAVQKPHVIIVISSGVHRSAHETLTIWIHITAFDHAFHCAPPSTTMNRIAVTLQ